MLFLEALAYLNEPLKQIIEAMEEVSWNSVLLFHRPVFEKTDAAFTLET